MARIKVGRWMVTYLNLRGGFSVRFYKSPNAVIRWSAHLKESRKWILVAIEEREWWKK